MTLKLPLEADVGNFLLFVLPVIYGTGVGPGLVHLPEEFKVSESRKNTMTWIKQPKWKEGYFCCIEEAIQLLLNYLFFYASMQATDLLYHWLEIISDSPGYSESLEIHGWKMKRRGKWGHIIILCRVVADGQSVNCAGMWTDSFVRLFLHKAKIDLFFFFFFCSVLLAFSPSAISINSTLQWGGQIERRRSGLYNLS